MASEFESNRDVLLHEQDGDPEIANLHQGLGEHVDYARRQPERKLVDQQQLGFAHQGAADRAHLLLAARKRAGGLPPALCQDREQLVDAFEVGAQCIAVTLAVGAHQQVVADAHRTEQPAAFRHVGDPARDHVVGREFAEIFSVELDRARPCPQDAGDCAQQCRLAGAVGADETDDLAFTNVE
jgi:hypothetical protein